MMEGVGEVLWEKEDVAVIVAMLEEAGSIPPGYVMSHYSSSPVSSMEDGGGSEASSVRLDVCPPSSLRVASPIQVAHAASLACAYLPLQTATYLVHGRPLADPSVACPTVGPSRPPI